MTFSRAKPVKKSPELHNTNSRMQVAHMLGSIGKQGHKTRLLERGTQAALMLGAGSCLAARLDLAAIRNKAFQQAAGVFVIDVAHMIMAKLANFAAR